MNEHSADRVVLLWSQDRVSKLKLRMRRYCNYKTIKNNIYIFTYYKKLNSCILLKFYNQTINQNVKQKLKNKY